MEEKAAETVAAPAAAAVAADLDVAYCSEHPYPPGAAAAAAGMAVGSGICAFCLQEKLGMLVSSSKSSPFHPPPSSVTPTTPPSNRPSSDTLLPSAAAGMAIPSHKARSSSSSANTVASGLRRSKSVAPRPEEPSLSAGIAANSPRKKSFWSFLYPSSSSSAHRSASSSSSLGGGDGAASARRKSVSVASVTSASMGRRLEAIEEPESPGRRSEGSSSSSFGRKVARSRSVGCGSRSFSGDFLERLSTGFGDCALRRVESHREPKPKGSALSHLGGGAGDGDDDYEYTQQHKIKCAGFFGGIGAAPPPSSSYWLSAPNNGGSGASTGSSTKVSGTRSHRSWAWALASPMRALRPSSSTSSKTIMSAHHNRAVGNNGSGNMPPTVATS